MKKPLRSKALLEAARDQSCIHCGRKDGTVVAAHYQGIRAHQFGKGKGRKPDDLFIADLCYRCHEDFDQYRTSVFRVPALRKLDHSEYFMFCVLMTLKRRIEQGVLTINK